MLKLHDQELTLDYLVEIWKQSALAEAREPEPHPNERNMAVSKLTAGLWLIEAGIMVLWEHWFERAANSNK